MSRWILAIALFASACKKPAHTRAEEAALAAKAVRPPRVDATALFTKFECTRCHEIPRVADAPREKHCVHCHQQIHDDSFDLGSADAKTRWKEHIHSIRWVPSLAAADRLRPDWIRDFLLQPHDIRPDLEAEMPRLNITREEATLIAAHLTQDPVAWPGSPITTEPLEVGRGEDSYRHFGCAQCHRFTGASVDNPSLTRAGRPTPGLVLAMPGPDVALPQVPDHQGDLIAGNAALGTWALAPDLRYTRERMTTEAITQWIVAPRGAMPSQHVPTDYARELAAFIATTPLQPPEAEPTEQRLPILERTVTFDEVDQRVFKKVCWHCHATADYAMGDGGPGNTGGFGFRAHDLDLSSYENISSGAVGDDGQPHSIFEKRPDGTPLLVAHLIARHTEEDGGIVDGIRGMPLGLPALSWEDIQLVETWIAQGRQR